MIDEILKFNHDFVANKGYQQYVTDKYPRRQVAILTCMDTRLTLLLPAALGLKNGDVKMIKNAGGIISDPFGNEIRSLLVAIYELHVQEVMVIHHTNCGACHMNAQSMTDHLIAHGIKKETIDGIIANGLDFNEWLKGFEDTERSVRNTVALIRRHPLIASDIIVRGFIIDSTTGELKEVVTD
jgi:carbonic anhydrase